MRRVGCCCLLPNRLATSGDYDYIIIESSGISEPLPVAETFTFNLAESPDPALKASASALGLGDALGPLSDYARLDTMVTVLDASTFLRDLRAAPGEGGTLAEREMQARVV